MRKMVRSLRFRQRLKLPRADLAYGLRLIVVVLPPLLIGPALGQSELAAMGMLGGLYTAIGGSSGRYRDRAINMVTIVISISALAFIAGCVSAHSWLAILTALAFTFALSLLGIFGADGSRIGVLITNVFLMILSIPGNAHEGMLRGLAVLICGLWAMVPLLLIWPLSRYQPEKQAVASYYRALAGFCQTLAGSLVESEGRKAAKKARGQVWQAYNQAYRMVISAHASSEDTPLPLQRLFLLTLHADSFFQTATTLGKFAETLPQEAWVAPVREALNTALRESSHILSQVAISALKEKSIVDTTAFDAALVTLKEREAKMRGYIRGLLARYAAEPLERKSPLHRIHLTRLVQETEYKTIMQVSQTLRTFHQLSNTLRVMVTTLQQKDEEEEGLLRTAIRMAYRQEKKRNNPWKTLTSQLTMRSVTFRHALRIAVTMAIATAIYKFCNIPHGFWIALTIMVCLKPSFSTSNRKLMERFIGTCIGATVAAFLVALIREPSLMLAFLAICAFMGFSYYQTHYKTFVAFIAPFSLLLNSMSTPGHWQIALLRVGCTVLGCILSFLALHLLWPEWERERLPKRLAKAVAANRAYLCSVLAGYQEQEGNLNVINRAYKAMSLANSDVATALQSLQEEPKWQRGNVEQWDALVTCNQQLSDCITALSAHIPLMKSERWRMARVERFILATDELLGEVERALLEGKSARQVGDLMENLQQLQDSLENLIAQRLTWKRAEQMRTQVMSRRKQALADLVPMMMVLDQIAQYSTNMCRTLRAA